MIKRGERRANEKKKERGGGDLKKAIVLNGQQDGGKGMEGDRRLYD